MTLRLLVADESGTLQKMVRLAYATEDAEIEAVFSGDAALDLLYEFRPDVVLAAVSLPGYSGYEVCELIRQDPDFASTPVILLSGAFDPFDDEEAARVEASGHLTKPFDTSEMIGMIERLRPPSVHDSQPSHVGQWGDFEESHEPLVVEKKHPVADGASGADAPGAVGGAARAEVAAAGAALAAKPPAATRAEAPAGGGKDGGGAPAAAPAASADASGAAAPPGAPVPDAIPAPAPAATTALPMPEKFSFGVSPRAWASFLGPERILEIFDCQAEADGAGGDGWPIPEELVDRVAEKVLARVVPELEALVQKYK